VRHRQLARRVHTLVEERGRLLTQEAERNRLRSLARAAGLRIRERLAAEDVLREARLALEQIVDADFVYMRLLNDGRMGPAVGRVPEWMQKSDVIAPQLTPDVLNYLQSIFRSQASRVIQDVQGPEGDRMQPGMRETLRRAGISAHLLTPFGVGSELLGVVIAERLSPDRRWTAAEIDAMESIAADLGRGLNHARLYERESRLVAELTELDRARSEFFATIAHELRSPLTTIEGYVEILSDNEAGQITTQQRKMLETIGHSSLRLRNLVEDLFTLSKLESGQLTTVTRPVDMADIIARAIDAVRPSVAAGNLALSYAACGDRLIVEGDAAQLDRVLVNLLSNAVKYTPEKGQIEVTTAVQGGSSVISVRDTGIGVPERDQKELFTRFFRASNATAQGIPGTGLGLAIVRTIVVNHGGTVNLESQEGKGTRITIRLPLLAPEESAAPPL
jgi:two-component system phosphate regulon sensor histidine kinase PhoR